MTDNVSGGAAAAGGMDYQARCAAWASSAILAATAAPAPGPWAGALVRIDCETAEPVDDIRLQPRSGPNVVLQCKRSIGLDTGEDSEFAKVIDQFVRHHQAEGHEGDQLVLATSSTATGPIKHVLRELLDRVRSLPAGDAINSVVKNASEETKLERLLTQVNRLWKQHTGVDPSPADLRSFLTQVHVLVLDVGPGEAGEQLALANLSRVVADAGDAPSAWSLLCSHADSMATDRMGADLANLQAHLSGNGIALTGVVDLQPDVARLKDATARELNRLSGNLVTIPGPNGDIAIGRTTHQHVAVAAGAGPVLVTGEPGAGKTVAVYHLARALQAEGSEVAFLPVGSLTAASLGALGQELGLGHHLFDVLAQWAPGTSKTLIIDSLDAARGDRQPDLWREVIDHVAANVPDWNLVVTIRRWDLQHSTHLQQQFPTGPLEVGDLDDAELAAAATGWPELAAVIASAPGEFLTLIRNPFNLRLAADLLLAGVPLGTLTGLGSQIELLDRYWTERVLADPGGVVRHSVAGNVARRALEEHTMTVDTAPILQGNPTAGPALMELLSVSTLRDATVVTLPGPPAVVAFAHHVLHDYALSLQLHGSGGLVAELQKDPNLAIAAAPSIDLYLQRLWDEDPAKFWASVIDLQDANVGALPVVQAADIAARNLADIGELAALTDPVLDGSASDTTLRLLRYLTVAHVLDRQEDPTIDPAPWAALALLLSAQLDYTEWVVRILVSELAGGQPPLEAAELVAVGEAARSALAHLWKGGPTAVNRVAIRSVTQTVASDPAATEGLLRRALEPDRLASHGASDLWQITDAVPDLLAHCPGFVKDLYQVVMRYEEESREPTQMLGSQLLPITSNRRQDIESAKYNLVQHFPAVLDGNADVAIDVLRSTSSDEDR